MLSMALMAITLISCDKTMSIEEETVTCCAKADCCTDCDDLECKMTCEQVSTLNKAESETVEGKALIQKCQLLCEKNGCCENTSHQCDAKSEKDCRKNCDDQECKSTCESVKQLTDSEMKTDKGIALIEKCQKLCDKNSCCETSVKTCKAHDKLDCCKK